MFYVWQFFALTPEQIYYLYQEYSRRYFQSVCVKNTLPLGLDLAFSNSASHTLGINITYFLCLSYLFNQLNFMGKDVSPHGLHYFFTHNKLGTKKGLDSKEFSQHVVRWKLFFPKQSLFEDNELTTEVCGRGLSKNSDGPSHHSTLPRPRPALLEQASRESALDECTLSSAPRYLMSFNPKKQNY